MGMKGTTHYFHFDALELTEAPVHLADLFDYCEVLPISQTQYVCSLLIGL